MSAERRGVAVSEVRREKGGGAAHVRAVTRTNGIILGATSALPGRSRCLVPGGLPVRIHLRQTGPAGPPGSLASGRWAGAAHHQASQRRHTASWSASGTPPAKSRSLWRSTTRSWRESATSVELRGGFAGSGCGAGGRGERVGKWAVGGGGRLHGARRGVEESGRAAVLCGL